MMTQTQGLPDFADIADLLVEAKSNFHPSEVHGLLCGYICATSGKIDNSWEKIILGKNKNLEHQELLQQLYETSYHQMNEFSFEFTLLLPDDENNINLRTEALGSWCQGFLTGLKQCNIPLQNREESDITETINDFMEIAQVNYGDITEDDEDETAYFELVEYVRLGALLIFSDLNNTKPEPSSDENNQLH